jgi:phosphatidylserine/phosphatidylglycerophosphate/cardiolipin synthase-like enzyme
VLTGSHNWSTSADTRNDENTVVVHDARLANLYHQEFVRRWAERNDPTAGLAQFSLGQGFSLFPNPAQEQAWVRFEESNPEPATLIMHDLLGQPLWKRNLYGTLKGQAIRIDGLSTGCYLITLTQGNKRISQKLFVP